MSAPARGLELSAEERWRPGRLWSLWDMLQPFAAQLLGLAELINEMQPLIQQYHKLSANKDSLEEYRQTFEQLGMSFDNFKGTDSAVELLARSAALCAINLPMTSVIAQVKRVINLTKLEDCSSSELATAIMEIKNRVIDGAAVQQFLYIKPESARLYDDNSPFGQEVGNGFPTSTFEICEASKCIALGRYTASVFHLMRTMEIGLTGARKCLGIPDPFKDAERNWGSILRKFKEEMQRRDTASPFRWKNGSDKQFFSEVYVSLDAVKNVWRNATMHVEKTYTDEEATHIFGAVRGFMRKLSSRLDEDGLPSA